MKYTTIGEACALHARIGWQGLTKSEYLDEGDYYLVTGIDFDNGHITFDTCHFVTKERYDQDQHIQLQLNDVLVTKDGTIGKVAFIDKPIDKPATLNSGVFVVRPKNPDLLLPEYLMIMLMSEHFSRFIEQIKVGCTIAHLNQEKFLRYQFPLPPVTEQKHIIEVYYSATKIIEKRQRQLRTLDTLIKARFVEMFGDPVTNPKGWEKRALSDEAEIRIGPFGSLLHKEDYITGGHALINPSHIVDGRISPDTDLTLTDEKFEELAPYHLIEGDVVMGRRGEMGRCAVVDRPGLLCGTGSLLIRSKGDLSADYIQKIISFPSFKRTIEDMAVGQTMPNLNVPIVSAFQIIKPPKTVQEQYYKFVSQVDKSKSVVQAALDKAQLLYDSLMQQYFG